MSKYVKKLIAEHLRQRPASTTPAGERDGLTPIRVPAWPSARQEHPGGGGQIAWREATEGIRRLFRA
jgi:hypothetical protein